jgi:hypothetical protein
MSETPAKTCFFKTACAKQWTGTRRLWVIAFLAMFILGMATRSLLQQIPSPAGATPTFALPSVVRPAAAPVSDPAAPVRPAAQIESLRQWCAVPVAAMTRNIFAVPLDQFQVDPRQSRLSAQVVKDMWRSLVDSFEATKNVFANAGKRGSDAAATGIAANALPAGPTGNIDAGLTHPSTDKILAEINESSRQNAGTLEEQQLSQSNYELAVAEMAKPAPDMDKAIWLLDCAITANPQNVQAIQLNQKLVANRLGQTGDATVQAYIRQLTLKQTSDSTADAGK